MDLKQFIEDNDVEYTQNHVDDAFLDTIQSELKIVIGPQMKAYILMYGYLAYKHIELYGVNSRQGMNSDMLKNTKALHQNFGNTQGYIALEDAGDGDFFIVDSQDNVYELLPEVSLELRSLGKKAFDYILSRFQEAKDH